MVQTRVTLLLNLAATMLKLHDYPAAVAHCSSVIEVEPSNVKAYYRRAQAHLERGRDIDLADRDADRLLALAPMVKSS